VTTTERRYREAMGETALERQQRLAKTLHRCCGEHKNGPHHHACSKYEEPLVPSVHPDQEALA
jgi:hypothetical protein